MTLHRRPKSKRLLTMLAAFAVATILLGVVLGVPA